MTKHTILKALFFVKLLAFGTIAQSETLQFENGDRLEGSVISIDEYQIVFSSDSLGEITVPVEKATVTFDEPIVENNAPLDEEEPNENASRSFAIAQFHAKVKATRERIESILPENWDGKINVGFRYIESRTETNRWNTSLELSKKTEEQRKKFDAYYEYAQQKNLAGKKSKITDQMGSNFNWEQNTSGRWFVQSTSNYERNLVNNINNEARQSLGLGYRFIDSDQTTLSLTPAVSLQYNDAEEIEEKWVRLASLFNVFEYKFNKTFKIKETASLSMNPKNSEEYQTKLAVVISAKLEDWIEANVTYRNDFNAFLQDRVVKRDERLLFGLALPF